VHDRVIEAREQGDSLYKICRNISQQAAVCCSLRPTTLLAGRVSDISPPRSTVVLTEAEAKLG
jgi:hypothetical protein